MVKADTRTYAGRYVKEMPKETIAKFCRIPKETREKFLGNLSKNGLSPATVNTSVVKQTMAKRGVGGVRV